MVNGFIFLSSILVQLYCDTSTFEDSGICCDNFIIEERDQHNYNSNNPNSNTTNPNKKRKSNDNSNNVQNDSYNKNKKKCDDSKHNSM